MDVHTAQVQASVQQLVMEHGEYAPLELLLATNRLGYEDYRAWREGGLETLDAVLAYGKREICAWLGGAQSWASALGLAAESAVHHGREENAGSVLAASADPRLNALLTIRFRHTREHHQLDLFIDSAQTAAVNALIDALTARNASEARGALEWLVRVNRDHGHRFHAAKLIAALDAPTPAEPAQGLERLDRMERVWIPATSILLGVRRRDFLAPLWRRHRPGARPGHVRFRPSRTPCIPGVPRGARPGAYETIGPRCAELREQAGSARPARGGPLEAARPCQGHRIVVRSVSPCARGVRAANRNLGLSGLVPAECVACCSAAGSGARDDACMVSRLDAARGARARQRTRPRATPTTSRRAPSTW